MAQSPHMDCDAKQIQRTAPPSVHQLFRQSAHMLQHTHAESASLQRKRAHQTNENESQREYEYANAPYATHAQYAMNVMSSS
jgi:hypothetical protein